MLSSSELPLVTSSGRTEKRISGPLSTKSKMHGVGIFELFVMCLYLFASELATRYS
jgi:hypothetical protein